MWNQEPIWFLHLFDEGTAVGSRAATRGHEGKKYGELREETRKKRKAIEKVMST